ncbi:MAG: endonuclease III domain-containing protein [Deltaproteobacteria bacterium]
MKKKDILLKVYDKLYKTYGPQHWWPGDTPFEVIVGAILTQNTSWGNVEKAIRNLKAEGILSPEDLRDVNHNHLAMLIRPSGYFNIKAGRLKHFIEYLFKRHGGSLKKMFSLELKQLRHELLEVKGIGPETADSILLYAGGYPVFVVDAYTVRIFQRLGILPEEVTYHETQEIFMDSLPDDVKLFNEYHALIVRLGKELCRPRPKCEKCPLKEGICR